MLRNEIIVAMLSLHDVHIGLVISVCLSAWFNKTDFDEIWYGLYAIGVYSKIFLAHWMGQSPLGVAEPQNARARGARGGWRV
jgi:hypothetical protein